MSINKQFFIVDAYTHKARIRWVLPVCIVFISMWRMFKKNIKEYEKKGSGNNVTTRNYAVHVRGLPIEATDEDIIAHFNSLYRLDVPSWSYEGHCGWFGSKKSDLPDDIKDHLGRPRKVAPVTTTRHSRHDKHQHARKYTSTLSYCLHKLTHYNATAAVLAQQIG
eukprot:2687-Heterococcus_DN1.PRE.1